MRIVPLPYIQLIRAVRNIVMSISVCLFVCPFAYLRNHMAKFHHFFAHRPIVCGRRSILFWRRCYVLPVLWMTSRFHAVDSIVRMCIHKWRQHNSRNYYTLIQMKLLNDKRQQVLIFGYTLGAKSALYYCFLTICKLELFLSKLRLSFLSSRPLTQNSACMRPEYLDTAHISLQGIWWRNIGLQMRNFAECR